MHIGFITTEYPPLPSGGIGTSIRNLARELVKLGHQVTVLGWGQHTNFDDHGVRVVFQQGTVIPRLGWLVNRIRMQTGVNRLIRFEGLDILEAPDWCGLSAGINADCSLVIRCHGSDTYFGSLLNYRPRWKVKLAESMALHGAKAVAAVSQFTAKRTKELFGLPEMPVIIPNGIPVEQFAPSDNPTGDGNTILYLGTIVRKKGVLDLCEIFNQIVTRRPDARLIMVGRDSVDRETGEQSTWKLAKGILSTAAQENAHYLGPQSYTTVQHYINTASICAFPSYAEALPLSWMEAMACQKAVVTSNIGWSTEIVENGISGWSAHPSDHDYYVKTILRLMDDPLERTRLGLAARQRVLEKFSSERSARLTNKWYTQVINS